MRRRSVTGAFLYAIREQPALLAVLLEAARGAVGDLAAAIRSRQVTQVLIAARGTSDNAATYAKYLLGIAHGLSVGLAAPSLYTLYDKTFQEPDALCESA